MHTEEELREIQDILTGKRKLSGQEIETLVKEFENKEMPNYLYPFIRLFATNPDLYRKISKDDRVKKYSLFGFFPETFGLVYDSEVSPEISFEYGNRGTVGIVKHPTKKVVIKPIQNSRENEVVQIAAELEVGPKQYPSLDGFLTEEFVDGVLFSNLGPDKTSADSMYIVGRRLGEILSKLHSREIYYNDKMLADDSGGSHVIVQETSPAILFDYGVALRLDSHPNLTDEEVYNFARTFPMVKMHLEIHPSQEQISSLIEQYRPQLQNATKKQIMARDIGLINEDLFFAAHILGDRIVEPFSKGFKEVYRG